MGCRGRDLGQNADAEERNQCRGREPAGTDARLHGDEKAFGCLGRLALGKEAVTTSEEDRQGRRACPGPRVLGAAHFVRRTNGGRDVRRILRHRRRVFWRTIPRRRCGGRRLVGDRSSAVAPTIQLRRGAKSRRPPASVVSIGSVLSRRCAPDREMILSRCKDGRGMRPVRGGLPVPLGGALATSRNAAWHQVTNL